MTLDIRKLRIREGLKKRLEVPTDQDAEYSNDSLTNRDIIPIPPKRRTWKPFAYAQYWIVEGISITGYTQASSLIGIGLSPKQSILCALAAGIIYGFFAALMGYIGGKSHIGFPVLARMVYGIKGSVFGIVIRIITGKFSFISSGISINLTYSFRLDMAWCSSDVRWSCCLIYASNI